MTDLTTELQRPEYQGLEYSEVLSSLTLVKERRDGKIAYGNTLHLVSMLARGLRARIDSCQIPELKIAFQEALHPSYLASPSYSINVSLPEIRAMLTQGLLAGVVTQDEHDFIIELAEYDFYPFADVKMIDIVAYFNPSLISDGSWNSIGLTSARKLRLMLNAETPDPTHISVQMSEDGANWFHATALHGIKDIRPYYADLPFYGELRYLRWRCEYVLDATVSML